MQTMTKSMQAHEDANYLVVGLGFNRLLSRLLSAVAWVSLQSTG